MMMKQVIVEKEKTQKISIDFYHNSGWWRPIFFLLLLLLFRLSFFSVHFGIGIVHSHQATDYYCLLKFHYEMKQFIFFYIFYAIRWFSRAFFVLCRWVHIILRLWIRCGIDVFFLSLSLLLRENSIESYRKSEACHTHKWHNDARKHSHINISNRIMPPYT